MKKLLIFVLVGLFLLSACSPAAEEEGTDIEAHDPWARPAFQGGNTAVYLLMHNHSENPDEMTSVSTDIAETAEIHKSQVDANGVIEMIPQASVPLPVDAEIQFSPGGLHIMLTVIKKDLNVGDKFNITLHFKSHADIPVSVFVLNEPSPNMNMDMGATPKP